MDTGPEPVERSAGEQRSRSRREGTPIYDQLAAERKWRAHEDQEEES